MGISLYCGCCAMEAAAVLGWLSVEADVVGRLVGAVDWVLEVTSVSCCW